MEGDFFKKALRWYNTIYISPACERLTYFLLLAVSLFCLYFSISTISIVRKVKSFKNTYILLVNHKDSESNIRVNKIEGGEDKKIGLLRFALSKYVVNFFSLKHSHDETAMQALKKKMIVIQNLSSIDVYNKYLANNYVQEGDNGDMQLAIFGKNKVAEIEDIEFFYEERDIFSNLYNSIIGDDTPIGAKVYFSTETTDERNKKQNFVATILFTFFSRKDANGDSNIEFKVNDIQLQKK